MKVEQGKKIKMEYELGVENGDTLESSANRGPLEYVHGSGAMLPGLERRIEGMTVNEERSGVIPASEAYGTEETLPTMKLARSEFPAGEELVVGKAFAAKDPNGNPINFTVASATDDEVVVRLEHPLAGKSIRFRVKILEISDA